MSAQSATLRTGCGDLPETWRRFYNGPNFGKIDIQIAAKEMPWLVGMAKGVTLSTEQKVTVHTLNANESY